MPSPDATVGAPPVFEKPLPEIVTSTVAPRATVAIVTKGSLPTAFTAHRTSSAQLFATCCLVSVLRFWSFATRLLNMNDIAWSAEANQRPPSPSRPT
jgi:hypothetical protein